MEETQSAHDILAQYLAEKGMRKTPERNAVLDVLLSTDEHLSAEQIYNRMPADFQVSRGTVYNTLTTLVLCGLASQTIIKGECLYERAYGKKSHSHYICWGCNKVWDFCDDEICKVAENIRTPKFKKMMCYTYIYGLCNVCQAKQARAEKEKRQLIKKT